MPGLLAGKSLGGAENKNVSVIPCSGSISLPLYTADIKHDRTWTRSKRLAAVRPILAPVGSARGAGKNTGPRVFYHEQLGTTGDVMDDLSRKIRALGRHHIVFGL